jgi:hypothetical protein
MTMTSEQTTGITVRIVKKLGLGSGVYTVKWRDGRKRHQILVAIDGWPTADEAVRAAVQAQYPDGAQPTVTVPISAWR